MDLHQYNMACQPKNYRRNSGATLQQNETKREKKREKREKERKREKKREEERLKRDIERKKRETREIERKIENFFFKGEKIKRRVYYYQSAFNSRFHDDP